jgi:ABC-2 type transport system permease protein
MILRRTWAVARKELRHIGRNRLTLFLVTLTPAMLLFMLAYVFSFNVDQADLAVMDLSFSPASRAYISSLTSSESLRLAKEAADYDTLEHLLVAGTVDAAVVVPPDFGRNAGGRGDATVQVIVDGANPIVAQQIMGMLERASAAAGARLQPAQGGLAAPAITTPPFEVRSRAWYNDTLDSQVSMVPGLMGIVLSLPALALALSLTREKELGTLEGLMATPMEGVAYLTGKTAAYIATGMAGLLLSWLLAITWFKVPFRGDIGLLILLTIAYFGATMGVSLLISSRISSQQTAMLLVMLIFFVPSFFLAGLIDPIDQASRIAVAMSLPLPATHYIAITRGLFLKGVGLETLARPGLALAAMGLLALVVSTLAFKKRLA